MDEYTTRSIYEAAYIYAQDIPLNGITTDGHSALTFAFDNKDEMARKASRRFYDDASAPARSLFLSLGRLKHELRRVLGR